MKILPVIDLCKYDKQNSMLHEFIRQDAKKIDKVLFITIPEQKKQPLELILEKENEKFFEKLKLLSKEMFWNK